MNNPDKPFLRMVQENCLVSICMITYNHDKWIRKSIEGVIMQSGDFYYELVISDDCSTDNTPEIIESYAKKYPDKIRFHRNSSNVGLGLNFSVTLNRCSGKYIAICEGDDFWTDPLKLQKQVSYLENNLECVLVSHNHSTLYDTENRTDSSFKNSDDFEFDQRLFLEDWITQPLTCVFRNIFRDYTFLNREGIFCDLILFYELLKHGTGYFMKDNMATFRVSGGALSSGLSVWQWSRNHITMFDYLFKYNNHDNKLNRLSRKYCISLYIHRLKGVKPDESDFEPLREYFKRKPRFAETMITLLIKVPYYYLRYFIPYILKKLFR